MSAEKKNEWVEKMKIGMKMMMDACDESCYNAEAGGCEICPFGEICGPKPYDPAYWGEYVEVQE